MTLLLLQSIVFPPSKSAALPYAMRVRGHTGGLLAALACWTLAWAGSAVGQPVASLACRLLQHPEGFARAPPAARMVRCACDPLDRLPRPVPRLHGEPPVYVAIPKTGSTSVARTLGLPHTHLPAAMQPELADGTRFGLVVVRATPGRQWRAASPRLAKRQALIPPPQQAPKRERGAY
mgnify:CR=1 FL=1